MVPRAASGIRRVTLSVGSYVYTSEIWRESESSWTLIKVQVHDVDIADEIDFHGTSCMGVLKQAETVAREILSLKGHPLDDGARPGDPRQSPRR